MLKRLILVAAILVPQIASAADFPVRRHHVRARQVVRIEPQSRFIPCTTHHIFGLFTFGECGGSFNPFEASGL